MIPNIAQSIDDIIKSATPEQKVLWQSVRQITGENAAIQQFLFFGPFAGTEFLTYSPNRLWLALEMTVSNQITTANSNPGKVDLYNELNILATTLNNNSIIYDSVAALPKYYMNCVNEKNIYFSRIVGTTMSLMKFIGFKIIY